MSRCFAEPSQELPDMSWLPAMGPSGSVEDPGGKSPSSRRWLPSQFEKTGNEV
jgi:hypothetical protein